MSAHNKENQGVVAFGLVHYLIHFLSQTHSLDAARIWASISGSRYGLYWFSSRFWSWPLKLWIVWNHHAYRTTSPGMSPREFYAQVVRICWSPPVWEIQLSWTRDRAFSILPVIWWNTMPEDIHTLLDFLLFQGACKAEKFYQVYGWGQWWLMVWHTHHKTR